MLTLVMSSGFAAHKFYVSIFKIEHAREKQMLQITSRIFVDDLNNVLEKKYKHKFHLGEKTEISEETALMSKYLAGNFTIEVNGKAKPIQYLGSEMENNVLICYFRITGIPKVSSLHVTNKILFDLVTEQQNIIQTTVNGKKSSLLLTTDNPDGTITY
jgi:hypothetical protein